MPINIPKSQMLDANGNLSQEWLIFLNHLIAVVNKLDKESKVITP